MKTTKCTFSTRERDMRCWVIESNWLLYLARFILSGGIAYTLTAGTRAMSLMWVIIAKPGIMFEQIGNRIEYTQVMRHEAIHIVQQREGWLLKFLAQYVYWLIRRGYWKNPFEVEAYKHDGEKYYLLKRNKNDWRKYI